MMVAKSFMQEAADCGGKINARGYEVSGYTINWGHKTRKPMSSD